MGLSQQGLEATARMLLQQSGFSVKFYGTQPCVDIEKKTIVLPHLPEGGMPKGFIHRLRTWLDHEVSHVLEKSAPTLIKQVAQDHGVFASKILNMCEDTRINAKMVKRWPGAAISFPATMEGYLAEYNAMDPKAAAQATIADQVRMGLGFGSQGYGIPKFVSPKARKLIAPFMDEVRTIPQWAKTTDDLVDLCIRIANHCKANVNGEPDTDGDGDCSGEQDGDGQGDGKGKGKGGSKTESDGGSKGSSSEADGQDGQQEDADGQDGQQEDQDDGKGSSSQDGEDSGTSDDSPAAEGGNEAASKLGPDKDPPVDLDKQADDLKDLNEQIAEQISEALTEEILNNDPLCPVMPGMDTFVDMTKAKHQQPAPAPWDKQTRALIGSARTQIERVLLSEDRKWWRGNEESGDPDPGALAFLTTGTDDRVFMRRHKREAPNTAVYVLIDGSSSMDEGCDPNWKRARDAAAGLAQTVEYCGHRCKVAAYQRGASVYQKLVDGGSCHREAKEGHYAALASGGRADGVTMSVFRDWHHTHRMVRNTMHSMRVASGGTPTGDAVDAARRDLMLRPEPRKVMFVLTDGMPDCVEKATKSFETARRDLSSFCVFVMPGVHAIQAYRDLNRKWIVTFEKHQRDMYGGNCVIFRNPNDMGKLLAKELPKAMGLV